MTSLKTADGSVVDLGSFSGHVFSECDSYVSDVENDDAGWSDAEYIMDSADDDVTNNECFSLTDQNESWLEISEDSSTSACLEQRNCATTAVDFELIAESHGPAGPAQLKNDLLTDVDSHKSADEVIVVEESNILDVEEAEIDICDLSSPNNYTKLSHCEILSEDDASPWPIIRIEPNWSKRECELEEASDTANSDFQCTAVHIDENGFVHPICASFGSCSDGDGNSVQVGDEYIDVEGIGGDEDFRDGADEAHSWTNRNLDDDIVSVTDWLFSIKQELLYDTSVDPSMLNLPQASYVDTVTVNSSGTVIRTEVLPMSAFGSVPSESVNSNCAGVAGDSATGKNNNIHN